MKLRGKFAEGFFTDQRSAQLCKLALRQLRVVFENIVGNYNAQNRVAEEFLAFVVFDMPPRFVGIGGVGHAHLEKMNILKCIAEIFFELAQIFKTVYTGQSLFLLLCGNRCGDMSHNVLFVKCFRLANGVHNRLGVAASVSLDYGLRYAK